LAPTIDPVLPQLRCHEEIKISADPASEEMHKLHEESIHWVIYVDNAPPVVGKTKIGDIKIEP